MFQPRAVVAASVHRPLACPRRRRFRVTNQRDLSTRRREAIVKYRELEKACDKLRDLQLILHKHRNDQFWHVVELDKTHAARQTDDGFDETAATDL